MTKALETSKRTSQLIEAITAIRDLRYGTLMPKYYLPELIRLETKLELDIEFQKRLTRNSIVLLPDWSSELHMPVNFISQSEIDLGFVRIAKDSNDLFYLELSTGKILGNNFTNV